MCGAISIWQASTNGSPAHPSYPAGHAVQNGAFATVLKVTLTFVVTSTTVHLTYVR